MRPRRDLVRDIDQVKQVLASKSAQVVDARAAGRFRGEAPEPRPNLRGGHMPGSINVPYTDVLTANGHMKSEAEIRAVFEKAGIDLSKPIVNSCGSGVTAAVLALAQSIAGHDDAAIYDASWCEWGAPATATTVETG